MMLQAAAQVPLHPTEPVVEQAPAPEPYVLPEVEAVSIPEAVAPVVIEEQGAQIQGHGVHEEQVAKVASHVPTAIAELMQQSVQNAPTGTLQRMREQGAFRQQYFKEAECFECNNKFKVGRSSRSANCPACGAYISLEDIELNLPSSQTIKTRGDVMIRKRGHLSASHLFARDLRCYGLIEANIFCSGDATFKTTGTIIGDVKCKKFLVEKGSEITFMNSINAEEVEVHGIITGNVFSSGKILIGNGGAINGDVTARSVSIEPGGELNGSMNIIRVAK
jgi:cytoskeletal protein CcmA (bactofilin family)/ribosomal protein S27E